MSEVQVLGCDQSDFDDLEFAQHTDSAFPIYEGGTVPIVGAYAHVGDSPPLAVWPVGASLASRPLDSYPLAGTHRELVRLVMAHLRELEKRGAPPDLRLVSLTLTTPQGLDERAMTVALDTWVDMLADYGKGSGVLVAEGSIGTKPRRHWHGLAVTRMAERWLGLNWVKLAKGSVIEAQQIKTIKNACLPLGNPGMESDIFNIFNYALKQHTGSDIVARGGLAECWREAIRAAPPAVVAHSLDINTSPFAQDSGRRTRTTAKPASHSQGRDRARACERCGKSLEGRRSDARYCGNSCKNMASSKRTRASSRGVSHD